MHLLASLLAGQPWAITPTAFAALRASAASVDALIRAGMTADDKAIAAMQGKPTVVHELVGDRAVIDIVGVLMPAVPWWAHWLDLGYCATPDVEQAIRAATAEPRAKTIELRIDSPGGCTQGIAEVAAAIRAGRANGKQVIVTSTGMIASAAYWIASQADRIEVGPTALVGAIGTYAVLCDSTRAIADEGFALTLVASGGVKGHGADGKVTPELVTEYQRMVDGITALFVADLAAGRRLPADQAKALATGAVHLGQAAIDLRLADALLADPAATSPTPNPTAAPTAATGHPMDLIALLEQHPAHAALIATQAKAGKTVAEISAAIDQAQRTADIKAKDDRIASLEAENKQLKADLTAAQRLAGVASDTPADPGALPTAAHGGPDQVQAEWDAMPAAKRANFMGDIEVFRIWKADAAKATTAGV